MGFPGNPGSTRGGYPGGSRAAGTAENISWGSGALGAARARMSGWLHSDGHRGNLLRAAYHDHGIGLAQGTFLGWSNAQIWVHHFGYCQR